MLYYDPDTGRLTERDAVDDPLEPHGWNRYIYVGDDPTNATDRNGAHYMPHRGDVNWLKLCAEARHHRGQVRNRYTVICGVGVRPLGHVSRWGDLIGVG